MKHRALKKRYGHAKKGTRRSEEILINRKHRGYTIKVANVYGLIIARIYSPNGRLEETLPAGTSKFGELNRAARVIDAMLGD